ncbi:MAG: PHB depolymerase family esterase [Phycisphaerae bacterium]
MSGIGRRWRAAAVTVGVLGTLGTSAAWGQVIDLGRGPVTVHVPPTYDPATPAPLVMLLHGYSASGAVQEGYMQFTPLADEFGFLYLFPDGTVDCLGNRFWNATDACCNFCGSTVDDSGYLLALIDEVKMRFNVDPGRVYLVGHSNGGFMAYRTACDHADTIAAIASLAGATFLNPAACSPAAPVHVLQIHGTADTVIAYGGGCLPVSGCFPGAVATVEQWASFDGCAPTADPSAPPLDLDAGLTGNETVVTRYASGCAPGGSAELWTIVGGAHTPNLSANFSRLVVEFLLAHPKPPPGLAGDANCDGVADLLDIQPFVLALTDPTAYAAAFPTCSQADANGDGQLNGADVAVFVSVLTGP